MKEILKIGKLMFSQQSAINLELNLVDLSIVSYINDFIETGKCEMLEERGQKFYYIAYQKILSDLPILNIQKRQLLRAFEKLINKNIIVPLNKNVGRKKTYFKLNLSQVKNSKYIIDENLFVINPTLNSPDIDFYLSWFENWFKEVKVPDDTTQEIKNKFLNLVKRISEEDNLTINGKNLKPNLILKTFINLFGEQTTTISRLKNLYLTAESVRNVSNKYKYLVTILYNEALSI